jgi:3-dehydroquinate dehydratase-2
MPKILLVQGPNMSYLGRRQPEIYGTTSAAELDAMLRAHARANGYQLDIFYTHSESDAIERLYRAADEGLDGLVMNPAAFLFAGYALRDCLRAVPFPYVEVHMTNIDKRGIRSLLAETAVGMIAGFGVRSYVLGLDAMLGHLRAEAGPGSSSPPARDRSRRRVGARKARRAQS